ncbi:PP2C family protein-serine/threonine phosphatase [Jannaschia sp. R86511]|uniref:PP2C family protein-serine/threonine phosphatase n=1 Tax=Jannaschia sp. R86511 TaxID=3093853 RepID=UPI0036D3B852
MAEDQHAERLGRALAVAEDAAPGHSVEAVTRELAEDLGASDVSFLMVDLSGHGLVRLAREPGVPDGDEPWLLVPGQDSPVETALREQSLQVVPPGVPRTAGLPDGWLVLAPVTERGDALGLLAVSTDVEPDRAWLGAVRRTAHVLAYVVIANRRHTDRFEWTQRSEAFTLPAEIQRRLLPESLTCEAGTFTLSAWLEPTAEVGGDTFDYSVERDVLHLSMTDAMGHGVASALTATLCVGSLRNSRRSGATLLEQVGRANESLVKQTVTTADEGFVTGLFGRVDLHTGVLTVVNAGHALPYLRRHGRMRAVELPVDLPLGMFADSSYRVSQVTLQPGDRLVLVTDGMLERKAAALDLAEAVDVTAHLHPREATRQMAAQVLEVCGPDLEDDATLLVVDWHGPRPVGSSGLHVRDSEAGADGTA